MRIRGEDSICIIVQEVEAKFDVTGGPLSFAGLRRRSRRFFGNSKCASSRGLKEAKCSDG